LININRYCLSSNYLLFHHDIRIFQGLLYFADPQVLYRLIYNKFSKFINILLIYGLWFSILSTPLLVSCFYEKHYHRYYYKNFYNCILRYSLILTCLREIYFDIRVQNQLEASNQIRLLYYFSGLFRLDYSELKSFP